MVLRKYRHAPDAAAGRNRLESLTRIIATETGWNVERLAAFARGNLVELRMRGDLALLNYQENIPNESWNDFNRQCRGVILDRCAREVVAHPYDKFFNLDAHPETEFGVLPLATGYEIAEKYDGTMITAFRWQRQLGFATRASFDNMQARLADKVYRSRYPGIADIPFEAYTPVFELIAPENQLIVPCGETDLILTGVRDMASNTMLRYGEVVAFARAYALQPPALVEVDFETLYLRARENGKAVLEEGWVIRFGTGLYVKLKTWQYLTQRHIQALGLTGRQLLKTYCESSADQWAAFLSALPAGTQAAVRVFGAAVEEKIGGVVNQAKRYYGQFSGIECQKDFACAIREQVPKQYVNVLFHLRTGKPLEPLIRRNHETFFPDCAGMEAVTPEMLKEWAFQQKD